MPVNSSCTYRVVTKCGYPEAEWRVQDPRIQTDYDIAWAGIDNMDIADELDGWTNTSAADWKTSKTTTYTNDYTRIGEYQTKGKDAPAIS